MEVERSIKPEGHAMHEEKNSLNRREFLKASAAALGGGMLLLNASNEAEAEVRAGAVPMSMSSGPVFASPKRLSDATHELARRSLGGEHGREMKSLGVKIDEVVDTKGMSADMRVAQAAKLLAERAPLRIQPFEKIVGSATVREAAQHAVPTCDLSSVSHTTLGFDRVLKLGYRGLRKQIDERLSRGGLDAKGVDLLKAMTVCIDAATTWHERYMVRLSELVSASSGDERLNYEFALANLKNVPENPPTSFAEAVQSLWFMYAFQRLCGNWSGIGRIDEMLGSYLKQDLAGGKITLDQARELIAHFWVKGTEWIGIDTSIGGSGDAQYYQNIVLAGVDSQGHEITNEVTYLVLDVVEELHISDFPIAVRLSRKTPEKLLRKIAEVQRHGGGIVACYNEEVVIKALTEFGYPLTEARKFANDGCWEAIIPGKTNFIYSPFDVLPHLQQALGLDGDKVPDHPDFESVYAAFSSNLHAHIDDHHKGADGYATNAHPCPLVSLFIDDCIERGRGYYDRGARYSVLAPHAGGIADAANSLLAVKKIVYEEKLMTLREFVDIVKSNWQGQANLRKLVQNRVAKYGNDDAEADAMVKRIFDDYTAYAAKVKDRNGVLRPAGISTFGRELEWRPGRKATPAGNLQGDIMATNFSPSPGTDVEGPTAVLKSYCKMDFTKLPNIGTVELKIMPASITGEHGIRALMALMRAFVELGGCFVHIDVVDTAMLLDAQRHPDKYPNLSVRIAGWSARFNTLSKEWQDMVIGRTQQVV
jgi:pyruvate-formate lyase